MLNNILDLQKIEATEIIDFLYAIFHRDFVANRTLLADEIYVNPRSHLKIDDKEQDFWHLTTREEKEKVWVNNKPEQRVIGRFPDFRRAERLEWVKLILSHHQHADIKMFYHRENNSKRDVRLYLWAYEHDFVVILQKLGKSSSFLVTSFFVDHEGKRADYEARFKSYSNKNNGLENCEWF
jgi:hypothetical protein